MGQNFVPVDRDQQFLLPPDMREWLPENALAWFVIEVVEQLNLAPIYEAYRADGRGRPAHDPRMMTALLFFHYAEGVTSSRAIERRVIDAISSRVVAAGACPDHTTIARFRQRFESELSALFFEVLALCERAGIVRTSTIAVDSTKLAANAALRQNRSLERLREEAQEILADAAARDAHEDTLFGDQRGDEVPAELADPRTRAARITELIDELQAERDALALKREQIRQRAERGIVRGGVPAKLDGTSQEEQRVLKRKRNLTDPDSRIVQHRGMLLQGYVVQTVAGEGGVVFSAQIADSAADQGQLTPAVTRAREHLDRVGIDRAIEQALADTGYWSRSQLRELRDRGMHVLIPPVTKQASSPDRLSIEAQELVAELKTEPGKNAYRRRAAIIEPVFAQIKHNRGITRLRRRGRAAVQAEIDLIATTHNLLRLRTALTTA